MKEELLKRSEIIEILYEYSMWLTKNSYMDTDWKDEEPYAIDEFLKERDGANGTKLKTITNDYTNFYTD
jgi:hypothetical protein